MRLIKNKSESSSLKENNSLGIGYELFNTYTKKQY